MKSSTNVLIPPNRPVGECDPPTAWVGGKRFLSRRICAVIAGTPHSVYCEPFIGMGGVFLRRRVRPEVEVINDAAGDVVNLFRVLQRFPEALTREMRWSLTMRAEFDRLKASRDCDLLDIERAARFLYLQTLAFGGRIRHRSFGGGPATPKLFDARRVARRVSALHDRLSGVVIENLDWAECLAIYDRPGTLFYLDPPYWGTEDEYGTGMFSRRDFQRLADVLATIEGRFLLSINDRPELREMFAWADIESVQTTYTLAKGDGTIPAQELLIAKGVELSAAAAQPQLL